MKIQSVNSFSRIRLHSILFNRILFSKIEESFSNRSLVGTEDVQSDVIGQRQDCKARLKYNMNMFLKQ